MPPPYHYPGRRDPEQEAEDRRRTRNSKQEALDSAAVETRAALLKHMGKIRPGQISPPSWDTYKNLPGVSGNSAMTDYILRYNAENPQRPFQPEVYTPQARPAAPAAPAVAPAAPQSRVMQNAPAVGVQASASNPQVRTGAPVDFPQQIKDPGTGVFGQTTNAIRNSVLNVPKAGASPLDAIPVPGAAPASAPTSTAPRPPGIRDDGEVAIQKFLRNEVANMNPDNRPGAKVGWAGYGGTGRQLVSAVDRNGMEYSDAKIAASNRMAEARADAYAASLSPGQKASSAGFAAWNKANPVNSYIESLDSGRAADAATAPRPVTSRAPVDYTGGAPAFARLDNGPGAALPSASVTMPNGKVERTVFTRPSATPTTDAVTNAGLGLDALMPGTGLAMTAGAMGAGAANLAKQNASQPVNPAAPLSTLDAAKAVAKQNADEEQRKQAAITAEQAASNKGASDAAQAKALTPTGSIQRPKGELDGIPLEPLPNAKSDGSMPKASEETIRAMTPQGLGQNVNDDPNSPYRLLAAAGSNPAAPMPSTSPVKTRGTGLSDDDIKRRKSGAPFGGLVA